MLKSHASAVYDLQIIETEESDPSSIQILTGSTDKTLRKWTIGLNSQNSVMTGFEQTNIGLLCDSFEHMKKKKSKKDQDPED